MMDLELLLILSEEVSSVEGIGTGEDTGEEEQEGEDKAG